MTISSPSNFKTLEYIVGVNFQNGTIRLFSDEESRKRIGKGMCCGLCLCQLDAVVSKNFICFSNCLVMGRSD